MNRLPNIKPMEISQYRLAKAIGVPAMRISEICAGESLARITQLAA